MLQSYFMNVFSYLSIPPNYFVVENCWSHIHTWSWMMWLGVAHLAGLIALTAIMVVRCCRFVVDFGHMLPGFHTLYSAHKHSGSCCLCSPGAAPLSQVLTHVLIALATLSVLIIAHTPGCRCWRKNTVVVFVGCMWVAPESTFLTSYLPAGPFFASYNFGDLEASIVNNIRKY